MHHTFSTEELDNIYQNTHRQGEAKGRHEARKEMGEILDRMIQNMDSFIPYRFPTWVSSYMPGKGSQTAIEYIRPECVELSKQQLAAVRILLCGPN